MRWKFKGKFSDKVGQDYIYECDNCGNTVQVEDIFSKAEKRNRNGDIVEKRIEGLPEKFIGHERVLYCPKCNEVEKW
jgi:hypothetical protein